LQTGLKFQGLRHQKPSRASPAFLTQRPCPTTLQWIFANVMFLTNQPIHNYFKNYLGGGADSDVMFANELIHQALNLYCTIRDKKDSAFPYSRHKKRLDGLTRRALKRYKRRMKATRMS
jgi:hypothetical protein